MVWEAATNLNAKPLSWDRQKHRVLVFLCLTLAITPVRWLTGWHWLVKFRRMMGLFSFFYGTVHTAAYIVFDRVAGLDAPIRTQPAGRSRSFERLHETSRLPPRGSSVG